MSGDARSTAAASRLALPALLAAVLLAGCAAAVGTPPPDTSPSPSEPAPADLAESRAFDLGVLDQGGDGSLDRFTINHKFRSSLFASGREVTAEVGLSPTPAFPGFEYLAEAPALDRRGLFIYASDTPGASDGAQLHLRSVDMESELRLSFISESVSVLGSERASARRVTEGRASGMNSLNLELSPGGWIDLRVHHLALPVTVHSAPRPTFVGARAVEASRSIFTLTLRDRHAYAVGDFNVDGRPDLFVASGGLGGAIERPEYEGLVEDEVLILSRGGRYRPGRRLDKGTCRGREAAAPDIDSDGRSDIFVACEGEHPIYYRQGDWERTELPVMGETYRWANLDRDVAPELLVFSGARMSVWERGREREYGVRLRGAPLGTPAIGDLDDDGRAEVYVPSWQGSSVVAGRKVLSPTQIGLPGSSAAVAIVDDDNDGDRDVQLSPQGLYERTDGTYSRTGRLRTAAARFAALSRPDLDNDGRRDALTLTGEGPFAPRMEIDEVRNREPGGRWIEVDVADALGARVTVRAGGKRWVGWSGEADGSRWSDTHRRVYFGVGRARRATVSVLLPSGRRTERTRTNRLLRF